MCWVSELHIVFDNFARCPLMAISSRQRPRSVTTGLPSNPDKGRIRSGRAELKIAVLLLRQKQRYEQNKQKRICSIGVNVRSN